MCMILWEDHRHSSITYSLSPGKQKPLLLFFHSFQIIGKQLCDTIYTFNNNCFIPLKIFCAITLMWLKWTTYQGMWTRWLFKNNNLDFFLSLVQLGNLLTTQWPFKNTSILFETCHTTLWFTRVNKTNYWCWIDCFQQSLKSYAFRQTSYCF